jgi:hypothetical protein
VTLLRSTRRLLADTIGEGSVRELTRIYDRVGRISYDTAPDGRRSIQALHAYRDVGRGRRAFILGNGPSLGGMNLEPLRSEVTFGLNRVYLLFEKMGFSTTYLVAVNQLVVEQCAADLLEGNRPTFLAWHSRGFVPDRSRPVFLPTTRAREFSLDPARGLWEGATVTYVALQLAYYMGFDPVILIGVDHSFATKGPAHKKVTSTGDDPNHFDGRYFGKGFRWNLPDLDTSEVAYRLARAAYEADGRHVLDATLGGKLTVFPKAEYQDLIGVPIPRGD